MDLDIKLNKLREERNKLQDRISLIQKQIDELEIQKYDVNKYLNQYIRILYNNVVTIMYVEKVERLLYGPKFIGPRFSQYLFDVKSNALHIGRDDYFCAVAWNKVHKIVTIITKEEATKYVQETFCDINYFK